MHLTKIILKDKTSISSPIERIRFDKDVFKNSYIKLFDNNPVYIKDMRSAITIGERISIKKIEDVNEIKRMKKYWDLYKKGEVTELPSVEEKYKIGEISKR